MHFFHHFLWLFKNVYLRKLNYFSLNYFNQSFCDQDVLQRKINYVRQKVCLFFNTKIKLENSI